jgi:hypothetical protein
LLGRGVAAALEHAKGDSLPHLAIRLEDVAYFEAGKFMLAKARGQRHRVEDVVAVPIAPLAGDRQKLALLLLRQGSVWCGDVAGVEAHGGYMNA